MVRVNITQSTGSKGGKINLGGLGSATSKSGESRSNSWRKTYLTGGTQVHVPVTIQKYHRPSHKNILDGCENFSTYIVV